MKRILLTVCPFLLFTPVALAAEPVDPCPPPDFYSVDDSPKFIVWQCSSGTTSCAAAPSAAPGAGCKSTCLESSESLVSGVPSYGKIIGIALSNGDTARWEESKGLELRVTRDVHGVASLYDRTAYAGVPVAVTPSGHRIVVLPDGSSQVHSPPVSASVVSKTPDQGQTAAEQGPSTGATGSAVLLINGSESVEHQLFVDDSGSFSLEVRYDHPDEDASAAGDPTAADPCALPAAQPLEALVVELSVETKEAFFTGLETKQVSLRAGERQRWLIKTERLLPEILQHDRDVLYGARLAIKAWPESSPDSLLVDDHVNFYRLFDVADDEHEDGVLAMARTLADGPQGVVRRRELRLVLPTAADVNILPNTPEFSFIEDAGKFFFQFDPASAEGRHTSHYQFQMSAVEDGKDIGELALRGVGEPRNKIRFNEHELSKAFQRLAILARDPRRAAVNPPDYLVHPALLPESELLLFDSSSKAEALAQDIKLRAEIRYGELFQGVEWTSALDPENTIDVGWQFRSNRHKNRWALGRAFTDLSDPDKVENWAAIKELVQNKAQYNKAELAYRLSEAVNPSHVKGITLYPDSILENHKGFGDNRMALTREQILNSFAKTLVHEVSHTMSLKHPIQVGTRIPAAWEYQRLIVADPAGASSFRLKFHGVETDPIPFEESGLKLAIWQALQALRTVGYWNYDAKHPGSYGVFIERCSGVAADHEYQEFVAACDGAANPQRTFIVQFVHQLEGVDLDNLEFVPSNAGIVETHKNGVTTTPVKKSASGVPAKADVAGRAEFDIMYGGMNDVNGLLRFEPNVSLEIIKMALALNYTPAEAEAAANTYAAIATQTDRFGEDF